MKKTKSLIAFFVVVAMLISSSAMLLSSVSFAAQSNVVVVFSADSDSKLSLSADNKTLTYQYDESTSYTFSLVKGDASIEFEKFTDEQDGRFFDTYVSSEVSSNENLFIVTNTDLDKVELKYDGAPAGVFDGKTLSLDQIDDVGNYQFRIETVTQQGNPGQPGPGVDYANTTFSVKFGDNSWTVRNRTATASVEGKDLTQEYVELKGSDTIKINGYNDTVMQANVRVLDPDNLDAPTARLVVNENGETCIANLANNVVIPTEFPLEFFIEHRQNEGPEWNLEPGNTNATVIVNGNQNDMVRIGLNDYPVNLPFQEPGQQMPETLSVENVEYKYEGTGNVKINFGAIFLSKFVGTITVNGTEYNVSNYIDYSDRTDWLNHYSSQMVVFDIEVPKADTYNITYEMAEMEGKDIAIGNFLWTDDEREKDSDNYIGNATLELVKAVYEIDGHEVVVEEKDIENDPYIEYSPYGTVGSLVVPEGAECTFRIIPDYGYQVTSFGINGSDILTGENISEFVFYIHKGNFHLGAQVTKVDDVVKATSDKVKAGTIEIGNTEIDTGTVVLSVNDANPSADKVKKYEEAAGEYTIESYLNIDLDQVFYKGTSEDVWKNSMHELNSEATIGLQLNEDSKFDDVAIIHNVCDGDKYEVIKPETFNSETNTVTFKTDSFSGYAIVVKKADEKVDENTEEQPAIETQETYTVKVENFELEFTDEAGHTFKATIAELMDLTDEQLKLLELTREEYDKAVKEAKELVKKYGEILEVYQIIIEDEANHEHTSEVKIKIKMTDVMKKFNTFRLICLDNEKLTDNDIVELKVEGDYLVGTLKHLSAYALVAENVNNNPTTGDNILLFVSIFIAATVGAIATIKINNKIK